MLMAAPEEARQLVREKKLEDSSTNDSCAWLDRESLKCRYYEFRPAACRNFEMDSEWCRLLRTTMLD